ncbi:MAG: DUF6291 domain-containing protein [Muribaculum sp.]|nr:DUF6291 domain-containing protein [Muribaculum sp.]
MRHTAIRTPRFDREWKEMIDLLPQSRRAVLERAIRVYQVSGVLPTDLNGAEMMAFLLIKKIVDRRAKQREARNRKKLAEATRHDVEVGLQHQISPKTELTNSQIEEPLTLRRTQRRNTLSVDCSSAPFPKRTPSKRQAIILHLNRLNAKSRHRH